MFNPLAAKSVARISALTGAVDEAVCEFGNQRLDASLHTPVIRTVKQFYAKHGYTRYLALDVNEERDAIICDLNAPVDIAALGEFDLVTDNGTGEHLFNQAMVWANAHALCKDGGVLLKIMPFTPWFNHGFYNFNPVLFRDVAAINDYRWLFLWIVDRDSPPEDLPFEPDSWVFREKRPAKLYEHVTGRRWKTDLYLVAAWQKRGALPFRPPLQGKYIKDIGDDTLARHYQSGAVRGQG